jgi:hypothetical protein
MMMMMVVVVVVVEVVVMKERNIVGVQMIKFPERYHIANFI